jgi:hypothetical protein
MAKVQTHQVTPSNSSPQGMPPMGQMLEGMVYNILNNMFGGRMGGMNGGYQQDPQQYVPPPPPPPPQPSAEQKALLEEKRETLRRQEEMTMKIFEVQEKISLSLEELLKKSGSQPKSEDYGEILKEGLLNLSESNKMVSEEWSKALRIELDDIASNKKIENDSVLLEIKDVVNLLIKNQSEQLEIVTRTQEELLSVTKGFLEVGKNLLENSLNLLENESIVLKEVREVIEVLK